MDDLLSERVLEVVGEYRRPMTFQKVVAALILKDYNYLDDEIAVALRDLTCNKTLLMDGYWQFYLPAESNDLVKAIQPIAAAMCNNYTPNSPHSRMSSVVVLFKELKDAQAFHVALMHAKKKE